MLCRYSQIVLELWLSLKPQMLPCNQNRRFFLLGKWYHLGEKWKVHHDQYNPSSCADWTRGEWEGNKESKACMYTMSLVSGQVSLNKPKVRLKELKPSETEQIKRRFLLLVSSERHCLKSLGFLKFKRGENQKWKNGKQIWKPSLLYYAWEMWSNQQEIILHSFCLYSQG